MKGGNTWLFTRPFSLCGQTRVSGFLWDNFIFAFPEGVAQAVTQWHNDTRKQKTGKVLVAHIPKFMTSSPDLHEESPPLKNPPREPWHEDRFI